MSRGVFFFIAVQPDRDRTSYVRLYIHTYIHTYIHIHTYISIHICSIHIYIASPVPVGLDGNKKKEYIYCCRVFFFAAGPTTTGPPVSDRFFFRTDLESENFFSLLLEV